MPRLFTALEIPHHAALSLSLLRGGLPGARWIDGDSYHLTLRFIGDVEGHVADEVAGALDRIHRPAFSMALSGIGTFGSRNPHTLWAGVSATPQLRTLHDEIERNFQRLGLTPDSRKFMPHITLARLKNVPLAAIVNYMTSHGGFCSDPFPIRRFVLMSSRKSVGGGPYVVEESWTLPPMSSTSVVAQQAKNDAHEAGYR